MTDRFHTLTVVLDQDTREDDCESLMNAIRHLKGVISVTGIVADFGTHVAEERARYELRTKLFEVLK